MSTYKTLLTTVGMAKLINAQALGTVVQWTAMAVGDGNGNPTTPTESQTALVRERYRASLNELAQDPENPTYLIAEMVIPATTGGWTVHEVGIYDADGDLVAVANCPATYKPVLAEGSTSDLAIRLIIQVSNTELVQLKIDPTIVLASRQWVIDNFSAGDLFPGGTTGQVLAKKSNADGDTEWVDPDAAVEVIVSSREETQTLAAGQTIIDLAVITTAGCAVYVEGVRLLKTQFTINTSTRLTLSTTYPTGTKVTVVQNEETGANDSLLKANNLSDLPNTAAARTNLGVYSKAEVDAAYLPVGAVFAVATPTAPTGALKANGAAVSRTTYSALFAALVTAAGFTSQTFTVTIASPAVFTKTAHGFQGGERLRLSTTGALPTGLNNTTDYFVERIDANTFYLTTGIPFGTRVNTSGTQSGTHSYLQSWFGLGDGSTTFNLPDLRGNFPRAWDDARGIDTNRPFGSEQKGTAHNFDIGASFAVLGDRVGSTTDPATGRLGMGLDAGTASDYSANAGYYSAASSNTGGLTDSTDLAWGVMRPRNVALLYCIKY